MEFDRPPPEQEREILEMLLKYSLDPVGFAKVAYPWGEKGTPLDAFPCLRPWQEKELELYGDGLRRATWCKANGKSYDVYQAAWSSGRGPGKSALLAIIAHHMVSCYLGANVLVAANTEGQLIKKIFPEITRWFTLGLNKHFFIHEGMSIKPAPWFQKMLSDQLSIDPKFYGVFGQMWQEENPDSFSGGRCAYGQVVLFDEASGIPNNIWDVTAGFFMTPQPPANRAWFASSQMQRPSGRFYDIFFDTLMGEPWHKIIMDTSDPQYGIDPEKIARDIRMYGADSDYVRVQIQGLPPKQGDWQVFDADAITDAQNRELIPDPDEPLIMGVDPAPRGRTMIRFRQGRDARSIPPFELNGYDNIKIAEFVVSLTNKYNPDAIVVDRGMGTGVIDVLKRMRVRCHEIGFGEGAKNEAGEWALRGAELTGAVRDWLPGGMIDKSPTLQRDMLKREWRWHGREQTRKALEPKQDAKSRGIPSPDDLDALALTFAVNPPRRGAHARQGASIRIAEGGYNDSLFDYGSSN